MRYAIVSDLHANLPAWKTVLADIADMGADKIICLGDISGYGPSPVAVLESVYRVVQHTLMGNHDAAVCGIVDPETFSPRAKTAVLRHRELLSSTGIAWLKSLPLTYKGPGFRCAHGDFSNPAAFHYVIDPKDALPSWRATDEQLLFVGHSHLPGIYVIGASGTPHFVPPSDFELEDGKRYIINPGSVGYPRVGDCRSPYCLFDDEARTITYRMVPFDSDGYRQTLVEAGLGEDPWIIGNASRRLPWLRAKLAFGKPTANAQQHEQDRRESGWPHSSRKGRIVHILLLVALALTATIGGYAYNAKRAAQHAPLAITLPPDDPPSLIAYPLTPPDKNLLPPWPSALGPDGLLEGWRHAFDDRRQQRFSTGLRDGATTLRATHTASHRFWLESPLINLAGTRLTALRLKGRVVKPGPFDGTVFYQIIAYTTERDGSLALGATTSFEMRNAARKSDPPFGVLNRKIELGRNVSHVRFRIEGTFAGTLEIEQPVLVGEHRRTSETKETKP